MKKFKQFYIHEAEFDSKTLIAKFHYSFDKSEEFCEELDFSSQNYKIRSKIDEKTVENILFHIAIALSISYYKLYPTKNIVIEWGFLKKTQIEFWQKYFLWGLWEFFYTNKLKPDWLFEFINTKKTGSKITDFTLKNRALLPIWWGKDSIVSHLILEKTWVENTPFIFWKTDDIKENYLKKNKQKPILVKRKLSNHLYRMNSQGYYNGHVPITGMISFVLVLTAYLYDYKYIIFSNEKSASQETVKIGKQKINHQYSKSIEFENDFREYVRENISSQIEYFSLLRGLYEIQIWKIFAKNAKKYFGVFSSCNRNFVISGSQNIETLWCGKCPKCVFVYTILRPFLNNAETQKIFWKELFNDKTLLPTYKELLWLTVAKPFECVWEIDEVKFASFLSLKNFPKQLPYLLEFFENNFIGKKQKIETQISNLEGKYFSPITQENIPDSLWKKVTSYE